MCSKNFDTNKEHEAMEVVRVFTNRACVDAPHSMTNYW